MCITLVANPSLNDLFEGKKKKKMKKEKRKENFEGKIARNLCGTGWSTWGRPIITVECPFWNP